MTFRWSLSILTALVTQLRAWSVGTRGFCGGRAFLHLSGLRDRVKCICGFAVNPDVFARVLVCSWEQAFPGGTCKQDLRINLTVSSQLCYILPSTSFPAHCTNPGVTLKSQSWEPACSTAALTQAGLSPLHSLWVKTTLYWSLSCFSGKQAGAYHLFLFLTGRYYLVSCTNFSSHPQTSSRPCSSSFKSHAQSQSPDSPPYHPQLEVHAFILSSGATSQLRSHFHSGALDWGDRQTFGQSSCLGFINSWDHSTL